MSISQLVTLMPFQENTVNSVLDEMEGKAIIADEVGLGKTIEAGEIVNRVIKEDPNAMLQFEKIIFVSHWQQYQYGVYLGVPYDHGVTIQHAIDPIPVHEKPTDKINCIYGL